MYSPFNRKGNKSMNYSTVVKRTLTTLFTAALLLGGLSSAHALTLQYPGPLFNNFSALITNPMDGTERVTATINLDPSITALMNGQNITDGDVTSFSMSALGRTITSSNATVSVFDLDIGPSLLPEGFWRFGAEADLEGGSFPENISSQAGPGVFLLDFIIFEDQFLGNPLQGGGISVLSVVFDTTLGIWEVQQMDPVPEPSTIILLGTGLAGIIAWRRKQAA